MLCLFVALICFLSKPVMNFCEMHKGVLAYFSLQSNISQRLAVITPMVMPTVSQGNKTSYLIKFGKVLSSCAVFCHICCICFYKSLQEVDIEKKENDADSRGESNSLKMICKLGRVASFLPLQI